MRAIIGRLAFNATFGRASRSSARRQAEARVSWPTARRYADSQSTMPCATSTRSSMTSGYTVA
jgi:hypothetical protein